MSQTLISLVVTQLALGIVISAPSTAAENHEWRFNEVEGNKIAWSCAGNGEPTVVLIAGMGLSAHDSFGRIYHSYDGPGRICMYDRAGMGESKLSQDKTRTMEQLVEELHGVSGAGKWGNAVFVAHSFGGFIARAYAQKYPSEVRAILFLDVTHEDWLPRLQAKMSDSDWAIMKWTVEWNERTFHEDYLQAQEAMRATKLLKNLPITVLTRGIPHTQIRLQKMSYPGIDTYEREHVALQKKISALSANSQHRIARYSSHKFDDYDPWIVVDEIKLLIKRLAE